MKKIVFNMSLLEKEMLRNKFTTRRNKDRSLHLELRCRQTLQIICNQVASYFQSIPSYQSFSKKNDNCHFDGTQLAAEATRRQKEVKGPTNNPRQVGNKK